MSTPLWQVLPQDKGETLVIADVTAVRLMNALRLMTRYENWNRSIKKIS